MASYQGHMTFSAALGAAYGSAGVWCWDLDWGPVFLGAGLTTLGGMLPDLDSDSGVPVRELFGVAAAAAPSLLFRRFQGTGFTAEQTLVLLAAIYLLIRYAVSRVFKRFTVHRGMYHSIPGMLISGLIVFLLYHTPNLWVRLYLACGMMLGFLSHLVLDELYAVDFMGVRIKLNKFAGSALKLYSPSWSATAITYMILAALAFLALLDWDTSGPKPPRTAGQEWPRGLGL